MSTAQPFLRDLEFYFSLMRSIRGCKARLPNYKTRPYLYGLVMAQIARFEKWAEEIRQKWPLVMWDK